MSDKNGKSDGGGVIVKLFKFKLECANHLKDDGCLKGGTISEEELIEGASDAVIIENGKLLDFEAEGLRDETFSPREKSVQRLFGDDDIFSAMSISS